MSLALFASCKPAADDTGAAKTPGAANSTGGEAVQTNGELVWTAQTAPIDLGKGAQAYEAKYYDGKLYYQGYLETGFDPETKERLGGQTIELRCYDIANASYSVLYSYTGQDYPQFYVASDGRFLSFTNQWDDTTNTSATTLAFSKADGTLSEPFTVPVSSPNDSWYNCQIDAEGNIYLTGSSDEVAVYSYADETGFTLVTKLTPKYRYVSSIAMLPDGRAAASAFNNQNEMVLTPINLEAKTWGEDIVFGSNINMSSGFIGGSGDYLLYFSSHYQKMMGYNSATKTLDEIFDWFDLDMDTNSSKLLTVLDDGSFQGIYMGNYDELTHSQSYELLTVSLQPKPAHEKTVLTYATLQLSEDQRVAVLEFNRTNPDYRIKVTSYGEELREMSDLSAILLKLNTEIIAGHFPDIIDLTYFPAAVYSAKGLLADMYQFIDADEEFSRGQLLEPLLKAAEIDGKLVSLPLSATIMTYIGKKSVVGDEPLTYERLRTLMAKYPEAAPVGFSTKSNLLEMIALTAADRFIDRAAATCSFDSEEFIGLLELCNSLPAEYQDSGLTQSEMMNSVKALYVQDSIYDFTTMQFYKKTWNDDIVFAGLPDVGNVLLSDANVGISAKSEHQDGAWAFVRSTLKNQADGKGYVWGFPITLKAFDKWLEEQTTENYTIDENGEQVLQSRGGRGEGNNDVVEFYAASPEDVAQIMAVLESTTKMLNIDGKVMSILQEECGPLFAGQKTAAETAKIIQSRLSIYIAESK
jgi:ABC-type glycerol-3-phosphate transport system substrate-binding protein